MPYAEVAVDAAIPSRQTFTYNVPSRVEVAPGHAVYVPFGRRTLQGVVLKITDTPAFPETRDIEALIHPEPLLLPHHLPLVYWLAQHYLASLFDCAALMLPPGFKRKPLTFLQPADGALEAADLANKEREVLDYVASRRRMEMAELRRALGRGSTSLVADLLRRGLLKRSYELASPRVRPRTETRLHLLLTPEEALRQADALKRAPKLAAVLRLLAREGRPQTLSEVRQHIPLSSAQVRQLVERGFVEMEEAAVFRDPLAGQVYPTRQPPRLTPDQEAAYREIAAALADGGGAQSFLLHGITGSGKTEVYLQALERTVALGKRAIVLVPEISLTPQTVRRFAERFPGRVAVMHSALSPGEHFDVWHAVRQGHYDVVIGPRSAVFAPQPDLGLIIVDEEHERTFKQEEQAPRYHARLVAQRLCQEAGAVLVLGSATPDIETYYWALHGRHHLLELPQRLQPSGRSVRAAPLPEVEVVDLREELKAGNRSIFSRSLSVALKNVLANQEQAILFLNRRGSAAFAQCRDCGYVPSCRRCAVSLTYHSQGVSQSGRLVCHHCNRTIAMLARCPTCGGPSMRLLGLGTERVEAEVQARFPGVRTLRWDRDVVRRRQDHDRILSRFLDHQADVLIGTQMLAKGLDIPRVTLVGVVSADIALHFPDFRSSERAFQLLEQVAGRAARGPLGGRVIIQTYSPHHPALQAVAHHSYRDLYMAEVRSRGAIGYPPFGQLLRLVYAHSSSQRAEEEAFRLAALLKEKREREGVPNLNILGPAPAFLQRLRGRWRWGITLRGAAPADFIRPLSLPPGWTVDVDPVSLL